MTGQAGPTLTFTSEQWAHLTGEGKLPWPREGEYVFLAGATIGQDGTVSIVWSFLPEDARLDLYQALVRAASRGERRLRLVMADHLRHLGYELIPEEE